MEDETSHCPDRVSGGPQDVRIRGPYLDLNEPPGCRFSSLRNIRLHEEINFLSQSLQMFSKLTILLLSTGLLTLSVAFQSTASDSFDLSWRRLISFGHRQGAD